MGIKDELARNTNIEELRNKLLGQYVTFIDKIPEGYQNGDRNDIYISDVMSRNVSGKTYKIRCIEGEQNNKKVFQVQNPYDSYYWFSFDMIDRIIDECNIFEYEKENKENNEIKIGALVKIRNIDIDIEDKEKNYKITTYNGIDVYKRGIELIKKNLKNKCLIVCDIIDDVILPYWTNGKYQNNVITTDMVEIIDNDFLNNLNKKEKLTKKDIKILDDLKIIKEMKSKVDIKKFKKIYASSMEIVPKDLKGIDLILHQWAYNKKHLYKMLGNKFSILKEIEYERNIKDINNERYKLYREFPGICYVFQHIRDDEIAENKLFHNISGYDFNEYGRSFAPGEKVSKVIDETFKNKDLNMKLSDIIAKNKIKGFIEISIDPIEILLMSCNVSGWTSCHTIAKPGVPGRSYGCFSAGIFSYMCDTTSMIAFRHDGKEYDYSINKNTIKAKSKNWRQMIWINSNLHSFIASRQYPQYFEQIAKDVRELLEQQLNDYIGEKVWVHTNKKDKIKKYVCNKKDYYSQELHYNDVTHGYDCDMCYVKEEKLINKSIIVGSHPVCPICGKNILKDNDKPKCNYCR